MEEKLTLVFMVLWALSGSYKESFLSQNKKEKPKTKHKDVQRHNRNSCSRWQPEHMHTFPLLLPDAIETSEKRNRE